MFQINVINTRFYLIGPTLQEGLASGKLPFNTENPLKNPAGAYVVLFRVLNNNTNVLVYNYLYYHFLFLPTLVEYITSLYKCSQDQANIRKLTLLDDVFVKGDTSDRFRYNYSNKDYVNILGSQNTANLMENIFKISFIANYDEMADLLYSGFHKQYYAFLSSILKHSKNSFVTESDLDNIE